MSKYFQSGYKIFHWTHPNTQIPPILSWIDIKFLKLSRASVSHSQQVDFPRQGGNLEFPIPDTVPISNLRNNKVLATHGHFMCGRMWVELSIGWRPVFDNCAGQNKNRIVLRFAQYLVDCDIFIKVEVLLNHGTY